MKKIFFAMASALLLLAACSPMEPGKPALRPAPTPTFDDMSKVAITVNETDGWKVNVTADVDNLGVATWDFGDNGGVMTGNRIDLSVAIAGTYDFKLVKITNPTGVVEGEQTFSYTTTADLPFDPAPLVKLLTSKPFVWAKGTNGHIGNGPAAATAPEWWVAGPGSLPADAYDDVLTFKTGDVYEFNPGPGDKVMVNERAAIAYGWAGAQPAEGVVMDYVQPTGAQTWKMSLPDSSGFPFLTFTGSAFPSYVMPGYSNPNMKYHIVEFTETTMRLRVISDPAFGGDGNAFFLLFEHQKEEE